VAVARDEQGRLVMVKRSGPGPGADRLRREAAALAGATGAGCVDLVVLADEPDGGARLTTAWVGGGTLATALPQGPERVRAVAGALAASLGQLHDRGLVHGRVAPEHVLLDGDRPVLCGLAGARLPGEDEGPSPEDDVAALLSLVDGLLGEARGDLAGRLRGVVAAGTGGGAAAVAARLEALDPVPPAPRREVRPRRAAPAPAARPRVRGMVVSGAAAVVLLVSAVSLLRDGGGSGAAPARPTTTTRPPCPPAGSPAADLDGDGCAEALSLRSGVVTSGNRRWQVGEAGDLAAVADWDCDGRATAAVVRPAAGEVWVYDAWATASRRVTARPGPDAPGATAVRAVPARTGRCARLEVTTAEGGRRLLDLG
jgi:hypothetical protein